MRRVTFIVSPGRADLYDALRKAMSAEPNVEVVIDRRAGPPTRTKSQAPGVERRGAERRAQQAVNEEIRQYGWAVVKTVT